MTEMSLEEDSASGHDIVSRTKVLRFLLVEDSGTDAYIFQVHLKEGLDEPVSIEHVESVAHAVEWLDRERFDLVLLDLTLPDSSGLSTFHSIFEHASGDAILILSGIDDSELAVEAVRGGAQDYILKGELSAQALGLEVQLAMERNKRIRVERELDKTKQEIRLARRLQKGLYPTLAPTVAGFDIAGRAWAAEHACGDYFDFLPMKNGLLGIVVGDVSGHGLGPALKMVETRAALHAYTAYEDNLHQLLCGVHRVFCGGQQFDARRLFLTMFLGRLDTSNRILEYSSAGHPGFHLTTDGQVCTLEATDYPVGLVDAMSAEDCRQIQLKSGEVVVIPTDGFYEAGTSQNDVFGIDRMLAVVRRNLDNPAAEIVKAMYTASREHMPDLRQEDDMAAIVIKAL
ncbi:MAG: SpoIIE family protein phosphatase [Fuerstiella sp.]